MPQKMFWQKDDSLPAVRDINHIYIVIERRIKNPAAKSGNEKSSGKNLATKNLAEKNLVVKKSGSENLTENILRKKIWQRTAARKKGE